MNPKPSEWLCALALAAGCEEKTMTDQSVLPAADTIVDARCAQEQRCDNIGSDKKYSSVQDCATRVREDWKSDLNARECPGGTNGAELDECLAAVRREGCNSATNTLARLAECTAGQICVE